jgi:hypothetical protein
MEMCQLGNMVYMAVATSYKMTKSKVWDGVYRRNNTFYVLTYSVLEADLE